MTQPRTSSGGEGQPAEHADGGAGTQEDDTLGPASRWFATTAVRFGLTLIGVALLLFALGQAFGLPLLELATEALSSQIGRWLLVAFLAVLLIAAAQRIVLRG